METNTKKKIGLLGCIGTGIGAIIGSGIFGSLPTVINDIGTGIVLALLATIVYTLACQLSLRGTEPGTLQLLDRKTCCRIGYGNRSTVCPWISSRSAYRFYSECRSCLSVLCCRRYWKIRQQRSNFHERRRTGNPDSAGSIYQDPGINRNPNI